MCHESSVAYLGMILGGMGDWFPVVEAAKLQNNGIQACTLVLQCLGSSLNSMRPGKRATTQDMPEINEHDH